MQWRLDRLKAPSNKAPGVGSPQPPPQWAMAVIDPALHCRGCGYDLRGLRADSRCPECGMEIWSTIVSTVDPMASRLPQLRNPPAVGNSLLALTVCMLAGMLLIVAPSLSRVIESWDRSGKGWSDYLPDMTWASATLLAVAGGWALWALAPPRGREPKGPVWIDIGRMAVGYFGWLLMGTLWSQLKLPVSTMDRIQIVLHLAAAVFATIGLIGLRGVFRIIGQRSREYRRSQGGRQSLDLIILTIAAGFAGALAQYLGRQRWFPGEWRDGAQMLGMVVMWVSNFMILIGLSYLVANAWWIRRALRRPPPPLDEVLAPKLATEQWMTDRDE